MICAVVLAAGQSRRMGAQKLLLPFAGSTVIRHIVDRIADSVVDAVYVVVGSDRDAIVGALAESPAEIIENPRPHSPMLDSVRCGLRALPPACRAALVALGDQPGVTPELVNALVAAFDSSPRGIAVPTHAGKRGHPLLMSMRHRERVLSAYDGVGLRGLLWDNPDDVLEVPVACSAALADMDCPDDYRRELARLRPHARAQRGRRT